jgi:nitrite reductase/ring-hydroxylating ferredoxin subunit
MDNNPKFTWYKIAESIAELNFGNNNLVDVEVNNKSLCIAKYKEELFACTRKCPHASGIMSQGFVDGVGNIVCPTHKYKFALKNGFNVTGEGYFLKTYPIKTDEHGIFIGFLKNNLFG